MIVCPELNGIDATSHLRHPLSEKLRRSIEEDFRVWKNWTNLSTARALETSRANRYVVVLKVENGRLVRKSGISEDFWSIHRLITIMNWILELAKSKGLQDYILPDGYVLAINGGDEPVLPAFSTPSCQGSGLFQETQTLHGFPTGAYAHRPREPLFPVLSATKIPGCFDDILFPHVDLLSLETYGRNSQGVRQIDEQARPVAIWRGSTTGFGFREGRNHRLRLVRHCHSQTDLEPVCDALFTGAGQDASSHELISQGFLNPLATISYEELQKFKYHLDIDGNTFSRRTPSLAQIPGVLLRIGVFDDIFLRVMTEGTDYLRVDLNLSNLDSIIHHLNANTSEAERLSMNKQKTFEREISLEKMENYIAHLLYTYRRVFKMEEEN